MKSRLLAVIAFPLLGGCAVFQGVYDEQAEAQCRDLPNTGERIACERAAQDAQIERRAENRD